MSKNEYIETLKNKLNGYDEELVNEIINDYNEHFSLGYAQGKSDEEIIQSLGDIDEMVKEIESSYKRTGGANFGKFTIDLSALNDLSTKLNQASSKISKELTEKYNNMNFNEEEYTKKFSEEFESRFSRYADTFEKAANKFADTITEQFDKAFDSFQQSVDHDVEINLDEYNKNEEQSTFQEVDVKNVIVRNFVGQINVRGSDEGFKCTYENNGSAKEKLQYYCDFVKENDDTIAIILRRNMKMSFMRSNSNIELNLELGKGIESLCFENCISADVDIEDLALSHVEGHFVSGDIKITSSEFETLVLNTNSGEIQIDETTADVSSIKSTSGDIRLDNSRLDTIRIQTVSGDVTADDCAISRIGVSTVSGDVRIDGEPTTKCGVESVSGDIKAVVGQTSETSMKSTSGDIEIEVQNNNAGLNAKVVTKSGDIWIDYGDSSFTDLKSGTYTLGGKDAKLIISSLSGDIKITD